MFFRPGLDARAEDRQSATNPDFRIVPRECHLIVRRIEFAAFVLNLSNVTRNTKTMRETWRNIQLQEVFGRECHANPVFEGRGAPPDIYCYVVDLSFRYSHQLALRLSSLQTQTAQGSAQRSRMIVLNKSHVDSGGLKLLLLICFEKETASIAEDSALDENHAWKLSGGELHVSSKSPFCARHSTRFP